MLLVIAGSRTAKESHVRQALMRCPWTKDITRVISGTAHGADKFGEKFAKENNIEVIQFPADWDKYGMSAGPRRNREMAENADALLAVWDGISKGTHSMLNYAKKYGLKIMIYYYRDNRIEFYEEPAKQPCFSF